MKNSIQPGNNITLPAPSGGTVSGNAYQVGSLFGVASTTEVEAADVVLETTGVFELTKTAAQAWAVGQKIYFNAGSGECTSDATAGMLVGVAVVAAANPTSTGVVRLNGVAPAASEGPQAAIADLTMGTNVAAATANGSLEDSAATNPSEANFNNNMKEVGTKLNAILAALRTTGIIAA